MKIISIIFFPLKRFPYELKKNVIKWSKFFLKKYLKYHKLSYNELVSSNYKLKWQIITYEKIDENNYEFLIKNCSNYFIFK